MKKTLSLLMCGLLLLGCSDKYDDSALRNDLNDLENRLTILEERCKQMNTNISSLQTIITALQNNDYITSVTPITNDGEIIGYTITFAKSNSITIYNGTDGKDGVDGEDGTDAVTPTIGVKQDSDGVYYWTLNGEWLTDEHGNKIKAEGSDGKDGSDGEDGNDGADGTNGKDGITPQFKIENDYWYISYNNGETWEQLAKATGEDGKDGDSIFKAVTQDDKNVYFELTDGTIITIAKSDQAEEDTTIIQFKDESVKAICIKNWDTNKDGELSHGEATKVTSIRKFFRGTTIQSFDELQYFTSIDEIGVETFKQCKNLTTITIPQNVIWIEESAFSGCNSLVDIIIPTDVTWIGSSAFLNCSRLENITIPNNVIVLGNSAFQGCTNLTTAIISNNITKIGVSTFSGCSNLTQIIIPKNVTSIGSSAFSNCNKLTEIYCTPTTPPTLDGNTVFNSIASNAVFYVPRESVEEYKAADGWKTYANQIVGYDF